MHTPPPPGRPGSERPIIVLGCPRSGTTLLSVMLHAHPRLAVAPETRFLADVYRARLGLGDLRDPAARGALAAAILDRPGSRVGDLRIDAGQVRAAITNGPPTIGSAFTTVFGAYAARFDKARWGDKRPAYYRLVPALRRLFPDAQFVHVVRDGRDCVASLLRMPWYREGPLAAIATWTEALDYGERNRRRLGPDRWHEIRYERLVLHPERELRGLCAFLGEDYAPAMAEPRRLAPGVVPARKHHHVRVRGPVDATRVGTWSRELPDDLAALLSRVAGGRLREAGYEVAAAPGPPARLLARYLSTVAARRIAHRHQRLADAARDLVLREQVAART